MNRRAIALACAAAFGAAAGAQAQELEVTMHALDEQGSGKEIGTIRFRDEADLGLLAIAELQGLPPGVHGFHIHENPDCGPKSEDGKVTPGGAAGGHFDPDGTGKHAGPAGDGHLGDLPALIVGPDGSTPVAVFAPRLKTQDLIGRSVMIHSGGDNYADEPKPLGGGGARIACGVVEQPRGG